MKRVIVLNPGYLLRHDVKRTFIVGNEKVRFGEPDWISMIHPVYAMILSFFSKPMPYNQVIEEISYFLDRSIDDINQMVSPFINNPKTIIRNFEGKKSRFPKNILIDYKSDYELIEYSAEEFSFLELDFFAKRMFSGPLSLTFMLTTVCATNCIYCYADNKQKIDIQYSLDRFSEIVKEAKALRISEVGTIGGEIFLYPKWKEFFKILLEYDYSPDLISTKIPIEQSQMDFLKELQETTRLQVSLDSINPIELKKIIHVNSGYINRMIYMFSELEKRGIKIKIATTLTRYNDSLESLSELYKFISSYNNIIGWDVGPAFYSIYKGNEQFANYKSTTSTLNTVEQYLDELRRNSKFDIFFDDSFLKKEYYTSSGGSSNFIGAQCSANMNHLFILPDGNVTLCEQLYWNPDFIVGNIISQSIEEVWNSERALFFANLKSENFREKSICKNCEIFENCHKANNKCWADIIKAFGQENWDYPDPRCKKAPIMINNLMFK